MTRWYRNVAPVPWLVLLFCPLGTFADNQFTGPTGFGASLGAGSGTRYRAYGEYRPDGQGPVPAVPGSAQWPSRPTYKFRELDDRRISRDRQQPGFRPDPGQLRQPYASGGLNGQWSDQERRLVPRFRPLEQESGRATRRYVPGQRYGAGSERAPFSGYPRYGGSRE